MPYVACRICGSAFHAKPSWLAVGWGKYCSPVCQYQGRKTGRTVPCYICGKKTYKPKQKLTRSKSGKYFCSKSCQTRWRNSVFVGPKHANWKDGKNTYRTILNRMGIPKICRRCATADSRILAGHHIDRNPRNNSPKNLAWLCHNCHFLVHHYKVEKERLMVSIA